LSPPVGSSHFMAPLLPEVLYWLLPLCERSCSYAGQTVVASARAAVQMIETQTPTATASLIGVFISSHFIFKTVPSVLRGWRIFIGVYGDVPVAISGTSSGLLESLVTFMNRSDANDPNAFAVNSTV
jgi:hypothetical protein